MIYLFKARTECDDVFKTLYERMLEDGHHCIRVIDESCRDPFGEIRFLKGKDVKLVTSDHVHLSLENSLSALEIIEMIKPVGIYYGIHDLAIHDIGLDKKYLDNRYTLLLPGDPWATLYKDYLTYKVGYPKFISILPKNKDILFAASLMYIYAQRSPDQFKNDFIWMFKNKIPIKFPNCPATHLLFKKLDVPNAVEIGLDTHKLLGSYKAVISNSASSVCVESAINGCISINIGSKIGPLYKKFNVHHMCVKDLNKLSPKKLLQLSGNDVHKEYLFDYDKAVKILTQ